MPQILANSNELKSVVPLFMLDRYCRIPWVKRKIHINSNLGFSPSYLAYILVTSHTDTWGEQKPRRSSSQSVGEQLLMKALCPGAVGTRPAFGEPALSHWF